MPRRRKTSQTVRQSERRTARPKATARPFAATGHRIEPPHRLAAQSELTFIEAAFPFKPLSRIAQADRRAVDPIYAAHRWWARRPASVMRGIILAASLPADTTPERYWQLFAKTQAIMNGCVVYDPFVGGGATLVEAARLGATPSGRDLDPLAVKIVRHELDRPASARVADTASELLTLLRERIGAYYGETRKGWTPLHYFYLYRVSCPKCAVESHLYRNLVLAIDSAKLGAVVRDAPVTAFCPECLRIHQLAALDRTELRCCGRTKLTQATFTGHRFVCPHCGNHALHRDLLTGKAPYDLLAVEETSGEHHRRIRKASAQDRVLLASAAAYVAQHADQLDLPKEEFAKQRVDSRPISFGLTHPRDLFTSRQLALFGHGFRWLKEHTMDEPVHRAITLALSNALTTNNRLCGYATEYGRLAPLFSVRSYSLPALPVELNPFHPRAGRGTLARSFERVVRSCENSVRRYVWSTKRATPVAMDLSFAIKSHGTAVECRSASDAWPPGKQDVDLCVFDPPYFDYIAYSELSEFYRAWHGSRSLSGSSLLPESADPVGSFGRNFARCLMPAIQRLKSGRPLAFTFHSAAPQAWDSIGMALDLARLRITALWPVRNDGHMGHHTHAGNCEWDIVIVCRRALECRPRSMAVSARDWLRGWKRAVRPLRVSKTDALSMSLAIQMAADRLGLIATKASR